MNRKILLTEHVFRKVLKLAGEVNGLNIKVHHNILILMNFSGIIMHITLTLKVKIIACNSI